MKSDGIEVLDAELTQAHMDALRDLAGDASRVELRASPFRLYLLREALGLAPNAMQSGFHRSRVMYTRVAIANQITGVGLPLPDAASGPTPAYNRAIKALTRAGATQTISLFLDRMTAWFVVVACQLVARHDRLSGWIHDQVVEVGQQLQRLVVLSGPLAELTAKGWDRTYDVGPTEEGA